MVNRIAVKTEAKGLIRMGKFPPLLAGAIVVAVQLALNLVSNLVYNSNAVAEELMEAIAREDLDAILALSAMPSPTATFVSILTTLISVVLMGGFFAYCMGIRMGRIMEPSSLLDGLGVAGKLIWCYVLTSVKIALWSMLFVFPGIVAAYRYRFARYNIMADPSLSASQAIALSCRQTKGMKLDLFVLDVTFLGWDLLNSLSYGLLGVFTLPYFTLCDLAYFDAARGITAEGYEPPRNDTPWEF